MNRKLFSILVLAAAILAFSSTAMAQTGVGDLRGHVFLKQADGKKVPVDGALIDIYRTDVGGRAKITSKKDGSFVHAGLQYVAVYLLSISAPGANPKTLADVKVGRNIDYEIVLDPGTGRVLTEAEAKATTSGPVTAGGGGNESPEDKAKREAAIAANAKIEAANAKTLNSNTVVTESFKAGNELQTAGNALAREKQYQAAAAKYDASIARYDEGIKIDPEHPGAPSLLTNRSFALIERSKNNYNLSVTSSTPTDKTAFLTKSKADITQAAVDANKAIALLKTLETAGEIPAANVAGNRLAALKALTQAYKNFPDPANGDAAGVAFDEYIAAEPDAAKKLEGRMDKAKVYFDSYEYEKAVAEYRKMLTESPDNLEASYWLGLALMNDAAMDNNNKGKFQNAVNQLQAFAEKAPSTDPRKSEIQGVVDELKRSQNVTPVKPTNTRRRGN